MLLGTGVFTAAVGSALWVGWQRQQVALAAHVDRLTTAAARPASVEGLDSLPPPVARYLRWALPPSPSMRLVALRQRGRLRTDTRSETWMGFDADHLAAPEATGFVWNARVRIAPLLHLRVRDAYVGGEGSGHVSLLSAIGIAAAAGTPEMNSGSLHRFLAEAVWYPVALLPSANVQWRPLDASRALATLTDHGTRVALEFRFADSGEVTGIYTPARWGTFNDGFEERPWEGHFRRYELHDGYRVPTEADVGWYIDGEWRAVWHGTILEFTVRGSA